MPSTRYVLLASSCPSTSKSKPQQPTHGQGRVVRLAAVERPEVTPSVVLATPETTYAVPALSPLTSQLASWVERQVTLGQASQLGAPLLGLVQTDSTMVSHGPPVGGLILNVAEVGVAEPALTDTDQLQGRGMGEGEGEGRAVRSSGQQLAPRPRGCKAQPARSFTAACYVHTKRA